MNKIVLVCALSLTAFKSAKEAPYFSGRIVYRNEFKALTGEDISAKLAPVLGVENIYYVSGSNYKMYTEKKQLLELYNSQANTLQFFVNGQAMPATNAAVGTPGAVVTPLPQTATVAGYPCQSLQLVNDGVTTVYYYSPKVRVNPELYTKHQLGDWYTYLKASNGALPLRFIITNTKQGFVMTSEATSVQSMAMPASEFVVDAPAR